MTGRKTIEYRGYKIVTWPTDHAMPLRHGGYGYGLGFCRCVTDDSDDVGWQDWSYESWYRGRMVTRWRWSAVRRAKRSIDRELRRVDWLEAT